MLQESNRIILVDDNIKDLELLSQVFYNKGIGCKVFEYDSAFSTPLMGVRIAFFDVNLNSGLNEKQVLSTLADALNQYIHRDNGPYILVFWTSDTSLVLKFKDFVNRVADGHPATPYYVTNIDKTEITNGTSYEVLIDSLFLNQSVKVLFEYEELMDKSIHKTITDIIATIPSSEQWGETTGFEENLNKIFASIAIQTSGYKHAKNDPDKAIKEALIPIYAHYFMNESGNSWKDTLSQLAMSKRQSEISFPDSYNEAKLNNIFHLEESSSVHKKCRGAICPVTSVCSIQCGKDKSCDLFENIFGISYNDWFNKTLPGISKELRDQSQIICVEISSACDFFQNKSRTNKYLLGILAPYEVVAIVEENKKNQDPNKQLGDYSLLIKEPFWIDGGKKAFCFNLNFTFTLQQNDQEKYLGEPLFGFKKEMMDMIGNRYANHVSRIGITSFR